METFTLEGFLEESSKLDDLKLTEVSGVMCLEPQLREMSNNVLKSECVCTVVWVM